MKVVVTGGAGFIGSHIGDALLAAGHDVVVVDNLATGRREDVPDGATFHRLDIRDREALRPVLSDGVGAVFHVAGQVSSVRSFENPGYDMEVNLGGTMNVVTGCVEHRIPRLLYASSMTVYGPPDAQPITEEQSTSPVSYYGISKYAAERFVLATSTREDLEGRFKATAFRMFNVYGPRQSLDNPYQGVMAIFMSNLMRGDEVKIFGDGEQTRDFIYVGDIVAAWMAALDEPATHAKAYNLGSGHALSMNKLVQTLQTVTGRTEAVVNHYPMRPGEQRHTVADVTSAGKDFGWAPTVALPDGIERTLEWAREADK